MKMSPKAEMDIVLDFVEKHGPATEKQIASGVGLPLDVVKEALWMAKELGFVK